MKIEMANAVNMRQSVEKLHAQSEMHVRVLKQELDHSEQQKLTQFQHM